MTRIVGLRTLGLIVATGLVVAAGFGPVDAASPPRLAAFPGAEGFGAVATGGRGGKVVLVTTLAADGPGSLGEALDPKVCEPRIVVFRVSGVIEPADTGGGHSFDLTCGDLTIAGQTAPGAGITIRTRLDGYGNKTGGNLIIRHLRFRPPPAAKGKESFHDPIQLSNNSRVILDHVTTAWGLDETLDIFEKSSDVTVQWSTIEASRRGGHPDGPNHNYALISGPDSPRVSLHHVLFAHHRARCPALAAGPAELVNSVIYDCQDGFVHHNPASGEFQLVGNSFIKGPSSEEMVPFFFDDEEPGGSTYWLEGNDIDGQVVDDIRQTRYAEAAFAGAGPDQVLDRPSDFADAAAGYVPISRQSAADALDAVLAGAGAFPRDPYTARTIEDVRSRGGSWGVEDPPDKAALIEGLRVTEPPADADADGMADGWEQANGFNPADGNDHAKVTASGYTAIEVYVNELADRLVGAEPLPPGGSVATQATSAAPDSAAVQTVAPQTAAQQTVAPQTASPQTVSPQTVSPQAVTPSPVIKIQGDNDALGLVALALASGALAVAIVALVLALGNRRRPTGPP